MVEKNVHTFETTFSKNKAKMNYGKKTATVENLDLYFSHKETNNGTNISLISTSPSLPFTLFEC